jgi:hypothetical protein
MVADTLIHYALPERLSVGPRWLLFAVIFVLLIPITFTYHAGRHDITRILTFVALGALTLALMASLGLLLEGIPHHRDPAGMLLVSAVLLWTTNVLVFGLWYWKLDAGGPMGRLQPDYKSAFLFPQMTSHEQDPAWAPRFLDYLFIAFSTSTAFSPTDTPVLSRWAKVLMMLQSLIALSTIAVLAARAVGAL